MTKCFNRAMFVGFITKEPEFIVTNKDNVLAKVDLAVERPYKIKDKNGNLRTPADFVRVNCWRRIGEIVHQYLHKGDMVLFEGEFHCSTYTWEGQRRIVWALDARLVRFLKTENPDAVAMTAEDQETFDYGGDLGSYDVGDVW